MYIKAAFHCELPAKVVTEPRERYLRYYHDLHHRYQVPLDESTFYQGGQYKFHELAYPLFDAANEHLSRLDLLAMAYWAHEFDPDYAACAPHLAYKYGFNCNMFDVLDNGTLCSLTALAMVAQYQLAQKSNYAFCFALDQTTIPRANAQTIAVPTVNAASGIILSSKKNKHATLKIKGIKLWQEQELLANHFNIVQLITPTLADYTIDLSACLICLKRTTTVARALFMQIAPPPLAIHYLALNHAATNIFALIAALQKKTWQPKQTYLLIIEEDIESLAVGMVIIEQLSYV